VRGCEVLWDLGIANEVCDRIKIVTGQPCQESVNDRCKMMPEIAGVVLTNDSKVSHGVGYIEGYTKGLDGEYFTLFERKTRVGPDGLEPSTHGLKVRCRCRITGGECRKVSVNQRF